MDAGTCKQLRWQPPTAPSSLAIGSAWDASSQDATS